MSFVLVGLLHVMQKKIIVHFFRQILWLPCDSWLLEMIISASQFQLKKKLLKSWWCDVCWRPYQTNMFPYMCRSGRLCSSTALHYKAERSHVCLSSGYYTLHCDLFLSVLKSILIIMSECMSELIVYKEASNPNVQTSADQMIFSGSVTLLWFL